MASRPNPIQSRDANSANNNAAPEEMDLLEETRCAWQPYADRQLTREDAREIVENIVGFFNLLHKWDIACKK